MFYHCTLLLAWYASSCTCIAQGSTEPGLSAPLDRQNLVRVRSADIVVPHYSVLKSKVRKGRSSFAKRSGHVQSVINDPSGANWYTEVDLNGQKFEFMIDTGSADTWILKDGFVCTNGTATQPQSYCGSAPYFKGTFSGGQIKTENFNASYSSGEFLSGTVGYEKVTIAGITVAKQLIGLVDHAYWPAGAVGLLGLAYPGVERGVWNGSTSSADGDGNPAHDRVTYSSIFHSMWSEGLVAPSFSLALPRGHHSSDEGYIAFGGLPPVQVEGHFTSTPIVLTPHYSTTALSEYAINIDATYFSSYTNTTDTGGNTIIDSGTVTINARNKVADAYNKLFDPPAINPPDLGIYIIQCNATGPKVPFIVKIAGTEFKLPGESFVLSDVILSENGVSGEYGDYCFSGIQEAGVWDAEQTFINLGRPFLENVVAVFDVGAGEMRFAQRKY
ncbi:hypothetical protein LTR56_015776 [Elasticomyces elasticus]|nr:hypothetical protein LTR56_015776 [Elasticomyces elasticus]KAK3661987.1 hypothetical protein LTR22_007158 [Elasticomyces elasticus]KAK4933154.1 hypothetical protein LTR49_000638 [Elasticomyces elasticus]KAK5755897.1 hypothetical protein LTS12_014014 [Elasticomyces elasticus]